MQQPFRSRGKGGILIWQFNQICRGMLFCNKKRLMCEVKDLKLKSDSDS